jgi:uncharacterized membrane protein
MLRGRKHFSHLIQVILAVFIVVIALELALVLIFWIYSLAFAIRYQVVRSLRPERRAAPANLDDGVRH